MKITALPSSHLSATYQSNRSLDVQASDLLAQLHTPSGAPPASCLVPPIEPPARSAGAPASPRINACDRTASALLGPQSSVSRLTLADVPSALEESSKKDAARYASRPSFDKETLDAWIMKNGQRTGGLLAAVNVSLPNSTHYLPKSSWALHDEVSAAIDDMHENYLLRMQTVVTIYAEFFDDVNGAAAHLADYLVDRPRENPPISIRGWRKKEIDPLLDKWKKNDVLISGLSPSEAKSWAKLLGPLAYADGGTVRINLKPLEEIKDLPKMEDVWPPHLSEEELMNYQEFAAFQSGLDIYLSQLETYMQTLVQKYSTANSTFDNLIKVLSSTIASLMEADKNFLNF